MIPDWMFVILEVLILFVGFCFGRLSVKPTQVGKNKEITLIQNASKEKN